MKNILEIFNDLEDFNVSFYAIQRFYEKKGSA